jgi:8-amino-7-oxononanoate synthase
MNHENSWQSEMAAELQLLAAQNQRRSLEVAAGINLCSNDYLALSTNPTLRNAVIDSVSRSSRVGSTGSRLLSGHTHDWQELEEEFAEFAGVEAALFFTSGYAANVGLLSSVLQRGVVVFSDALNHASLIDGIRLSAAERVIYPHCDLAALEALLQAHQLSRARKLIVTESVFSMDGDLAPLAEIHGLAQKYGAEIIVDEAHTIGVIGPQGRGRVAQLGLEREVLAIVYPCGKALASAGAFVCGSSTLKQFLINRARTFIFSTALPPYMAGQIRVALDLAQSADPERARLAEMSALLRGSLQSAGFDIARSASQIVPIVLGENSRALEYAHALEKSGYAARAIRPPTVPEGTSRIRVALTCALQDAEVAQLYAVLAAIRTRERVTSAAHG